MTPIYIKQFKKENKCPACPAKKQGVRSMCAYHLRLARERFASWTVERRAAGKCAYCHCKSFKGWIRCKKHREYNKVKCAAWTTRMIAKNPNFQADRHLARRKMYTDNGLCLYCKDHRPMVPGTIHCQPCLDNVRLLEAGQRKPFQYTSRDTGKL